MPIYKLEENTNNKEYIVGCNCNSPDHQLSIGWFIPNENDNCKEVYFSYHLYPFAFWKRVWYAIKYVFGWRSMFGDYEELTLFPEDVERMVGILKEAKEDLQ